MVEWWSSFRVILAPVFAYSLIFVLHMMGRRSGIDADLDYLLTLAGLVSLASIGLLARRVRQLEGEVRAIRRGGPSA